MCCRCSSPRGGAAAGLCEFTELRRGVKRTNHPEETACGVTRLVAVVLAAMSAAIVVKLPGFDVLAFLEGELANFAARIACGNAQDFSGAFSGIAAEVGVIYLDGALAGKQFADAPGDVNETVACAPLGPHHTPAWSVIFHKAAVVIVELAGVDIVAFREIKFLRFATEVAGANVQSFSLAFGGIATEIGVIDLDGAGAGKHDADTVGDID